ncbi:MAG: class I adenylate-forming enzyme family protein [Chthoniobacterales bacterium]
MKSGETDSLLEAWRKTLERRGDAPAIFDTSGQVTRTFAGIEEEAGALARNLLGELVPGEVVAIQAGNHVGWPALLLACLRRKLVVLPIEHTLSAGDRDAALTACGARHVVVATTAGGKLELSAVENGAARSEAATAHYWGGAVPSLLKLTSGTTSAPRAIKFRSDQLLADCVQICDTMGIGNADVSFAVISVSHSYGFSNLITPLIARGVPMVLSRDRMPRAVLHDLARTKATVFPGMPVFYQAFCEMSDVPKLPHLRLCISAGAPLPLDVARKFRDKFKRPIHSFYGSSECGGICYDANAALQEEGFVGRAMRDLDLKLLDPDAPNSRARIGSAAVGDGYFPVHDEEKLGHGNFTPDDLLCATPAGFRIVGRISDLINVAGKKVNPAEVEAELMRLDGVRAAVVFGRDSSLRNQEVAACVVAAGNVSEQMLLESCRRRLSGWQVPKRIFIVPEIPVNERGKLSRRALAERFAGQS